MTVQLFARKAIYAAIESSYALTTAVSGTDAIETNGVTITPANVVGADKEFDRNYFGADKQITIGATVDVSFGAYLSGSGAANTAPRTDRFFRACGFSAATAQAAGTYQGSTGALPANVTFGRVVVITSGINRGKVYVGTPQGWQEVVGRSHANDFTNNITVSAADPTSSVANGSGHLNSSSGELFIRESSAWRSLDDLSDLSFPASQRMNLVSDSIASAKIRAEAHGVYHGIEGCRGTFGIEMAAGGLPMVNFEMRGIYSDAFTTGTLTPSYGGMADPTGFGRTETRVWLHGYEVVCSAFSFDLNNQLEYINNSNFEQVEVLDRNPSGSVTIQLDSSLTPNFSKIAKEGASSWMRVMQGTTAGSIFEMQLPNIQLMNPQLVDDQGRYMVQMDYRPIAGSSGNDEFTILFR